MTLPVRSGMEYASIIWDPYTKADSNKLEKIKRTAARWILSSYSYKISVTSLLQQLQLECLEERRKVLLLAFMYKILNGRVAVYQQLLSNLSVFQTFSRHRCQPTETDYCEILHVQA